jgi:hypothetical protein
MQVIYCPNCQKRTGFKRALGFGTFFMVLITCGLWLLVIPFYPARCINCGVPRSEAALAWFASSPKWVQGLTAITGLAIVCVVVINLPADQQAHLVPSIIKGPNYNEVPSRRTESSASASASAAPEIATVPEVAPTMRDSPERVDSTSFLSAYQSDERAANARYEKKRVAVTGVLTGVFVPSIDVSLRMAAKGIPAVPFVTMGGPHPRSVEETLLLPRNPGEI